MLSFIPTWLKFIYLVGMVVNFILIVLSLLYVKLSGDFKETFTHFSATEGKNIFAWKALLVICIILIILSWFGFILLVVRLDK